MVDEKVKYRVVEITVKRNECEEMKLVVSAESGIREWAEVFKIILQWLTFPPDTINEVIKIEEDAE